MRLTWIGFLRRTDTPESHILLLVGGRTPAATRTLIDSQFRQGKIDRESCEIRLTCFDTLQAEYARTRPCVDERDPKDWIPLPRGGYRRATHLDSTQTER